MAFAVLFVCSGNVCRSPMAERLLRVRLDKPSPIVCSSAGTRALAGRPMEPHAARVLRELGGDPGGHVARALTEKQIEAADLILTAEAAHRADVLALVPLAFRRIFTLREFGRLGKGLKPVPATEQDLRARVGDVANQRGLAATVDVRADDLVDPFRQFSVTARMAGRQAAAGVDALMAVLGLASLPAARSGVPAQRSEDWALAQWNRRWPPVDRLDADATGFAEPKSSGAVPGS